jgi:hypothetical protein
MPKHSDFIKIHARFVKQYGKKGDDMYYAWLNKKGYDDTKPFPKGKEKKEFMCNVRGLEIKELPGEFHIEGLIATTHVDNVNMEEGVEISDKILKETLEDFAMQINTLPDARVMGVHHSEGHPFCPEFFGVADFEKNPARVIPLSDGEFGLYVDTKLLKNDPATPDIIKEFQDGTLNSFSIAYDTDGFMTTDFDWVGDNLVRILLPGTRLAGYTAASNPKNPNAVATAYGFKEFKELVGMDQLNKMEVKKMPKEEFKEGETPQRGTGEPSSTEVKEQPSNKPEGYSEAEKKEFLEYKAKKKDLEEKELLDKTAGKIAEGVLSKMEMKEKVLKDNTPSNKNTEVSLEIKEFREVIEHPGKLELKEQFRRASAVCDAIKLDWQAAHTSAVESREYKSFGVSGRHLEFKGLSITTNQNTDTDYLQSSAELQDVYDPVIYNALNQETVTWNLLAKDDYSKKGNNKCQFTLKIAANASASFYSGNAVTTGNVTRLKYETKFKKLQVGVSVDGDMIAAARGGPVSDVFAQEVMDSTLDMLAVLNAALFAEVGLETATAIIGFEYITDSAGNTSLYNLTRSAANKLAPDSATDTYINQSSAVVSMTNLRAAIKQAVVEGAKKSKLVFITNPTQANLLRGKFDDERRLLTSRDTDFGFSTDLSVDSVPVFEDKDCNTDDWWLVDLETHRVAIWIPPTIEKLGKSADSEDAFIKSYLATYNRAPRRMVQIYGCATA